MKIPTEIVDAGIPILDAVNIKINDRATEGIKYGKKATLLTVTPNNDLRFLDTAYPINKPNNPAKNPQATDRPIEPNNAFQTRLSFNRPTYPAEALPIGSLDIQASNDNPPEKSPEFLSRDSKKNEIIGPKQTIATRILKIEPVTQRPTLPRLRLLI